MFKQLQNLELTLESLDFVLVQLKVGKGRFSFRCRVPLSF